MRLLPVVWSGLRVLIVCLFLVAGFGSLSLPTEAVDDANTARFRDQLADIATRKRRTLIDLDGVLDQQKTYQEYIADLNQTISQIRADIDANEADIEQIKADLRTTEIAVDQGQLVLAHLLGLLYKQTEISPVELLLSAESFSDYIDSREYIDRLKNEVTGSLGDLISQQELLERQKADREQAQGDLNVRRQSVTQIQDRQQYLLEVTREKESVFQDILAELAADQARIERELEAYIESLIRQQVSLGPVAAGTVIGRMGNTGWSTGPHLHIAIYKNAEVRYDPATYIVNNNLVWPVGGYGGTPTDYYRPGHRALDIGGPAGLPIKAIAAGEIRHRGCLFVGGKYATFGVIISHGSYHSLYIHLQAPDNPKYNDCNTNRRPGSRLYGQKSVDYTTTE